MVWATLLNVLLICGIVVRAMPDVTYSDLHHCHLFRSILGNFHLKGMCNTQSQSTYCCTTYSVKLLGSSLSVGPTAPPCSRIRTYYSPTLHLMWDSIYCWNGINYINGVTHSDTGLLFQLWHPYSIQVWFMVDLSSTYHFSNLSCDLPVYASLCVIVTSYRDDQVTFYFSWCWSSSFSWQVFTQTLHFETLPVRRDLPVQKLAWRWRLTWSLSTKKHQTSMAMCMGEHPQISTGDDRPTWSYTHQYCHFQLRKWFQDISSIGECWGVQCVLGQKSGPTRNHLWPGLVGHGPGWKSGRCLSLSRFKQIR